MRFSVPQFIDVEDKIFGPFTLKQAIYLAGGIGTMVTLLVQFGFFEAVVIGGPVLMLALALAFFTINNRPFYLVVYSAVFYFARNKLYLWKKEQKRIDVTKKHPIETPRTQPVTQKVSSSRLKELAWSLDTGESMYTTKTQWKQ